MSILNQTKQNASNSVNAVATESSKWQIYPPLASAVYLHWELGDIIFGCNRPVAYSGFTFFTLCNLAFTISFTWVSPFHPLTSLFSSVKLWGRLTGDKLKALRLGLHTAAHDAVCIQCARAHTHTLCFDWYLTETELLLLSEPQLSLLSLLISDICRYYIHGARRQYFVMWSPVTL